MNDWFSRYPKFSTHKASKSFTVNCTYPRPLFEPFPIAPPFLLFVLFKCDDPPGLETLESDADRLSESAPSETELRRNPPPVCPEMVTKQLIHFFNDISSIVFCLETNC